jgi:hypothetical protein
MSDQSQALVPTDVRSVDFYGDQVTGAVVASGTIYVPLRPICEYLGLSWGSQRNRIARDDVLHDQIRGVFITNTPGAGGGTQEMLCLPLDLLPGFLFGVSTARIKPELREKITRYRRECFRRLWEAFKPDILGNVTITPPAEQSGAQIAYEMATAIQHLARQQLDFEQRLDRSARWAKTIEGRVASIEVQIGSDGQVSEAQAAEIAGAVKTVAHALEVRGAANGYQRVYGELYRRFGVSTYKSLPRSRLQEVLEWLKTWHTEASTPPAAE